MIPANKERLRRRRMVQGSVIAVLILIGNGPFVTSWAGKQYDDWRSHQLSYEKQYGRWDVVADSAGRSIHAAVLHTGQVLLMAGSGNDQANFNEKKYSTLLWNPTTNVFQSVATPWDVFCAGHSFLPDGQLLIAGGTAKYEILAQDSPTGKQQEFEGLKDTYIFNPDTERYEKVGDLNYARWYPTLVTMPNGAVVAVSGLDDKGNIDNGNTESYDQTTKKWVLHPDLHRVFPTYPSLLVTADGRLFFSGANAGYGPASVQQRQPGLWNLTNNAFQPVKGLPDPEDNETAATVMLAPAQDQKVMFLGGGGVGDSQVATARTAIVDLTKPAPAWVAGPNLSVAKRYPGAVVLPDDTVLVSGGSKGYRAKDTKTAQIYHPDTNTFTTAADPHIGRDYHSEYLLLPDGRVAVFGSNPLTDNNFFDTHVEIYSPPYIYAGNRPSITSSPQTMKLGTSVTIKASQKIAKVRLIRPGAYTHVTDTEARSVALPITAQANGSIRVSVPSNANLLPPDWYMLFVDNGAGTPSVAQWVHVG
jgi:Domain of unknown function (DUF1929)